MPAESVSRNKGIKKAPGQKRTKTGCALCRQRRAKCDEIKPSCTRCIKAGAECLWPLDMPKQRVFRPFDARAVTVPACTPTFGASESSPSSSESRPMNAVASSSRSSIDPCSQYRRLASIATLYKEPSSVLELSYPDGGERMLMHHYLCLLYLGLDSDQPPGSLELQPSWAPPQSMDQKVPGLDVREFLSTPTRSTMAHEAVSLGYLATGAVYLANLYHLSARRYLLDSVPDLAIPNLQSEARYLQMSTSMIDSAFALIQSSRLLLTTKVQVASPFDPQANGSVIRPCPARLEDSVLDQLDLLLVALTGVFWTRCCAGGSGYQDVMDTAKLMIGMAGGPVAMLERAKSIGPVKLRRVRCTLEEFVMWEEFACLSSGRAPDLSVSPPVLADAPPSVPCELSSWWFAYSTPSGAPRSASSMDWETIEAAMGISRGLLELLHRVNRLYALSRPPERCPLAPTLLYPLVLDPCWTVQAQALLAECEAWKAAYSAHPPGVERTRLDMGNIVFTTMIEMILLMDLLFYRPDHPEIQQRAATIYRLLLLERDETGYVFGLMWPMFIAGSVACSPAAQADAMAALKGFSDYCCFDFYTAGRVMEKVWKRREETGDGYCSWRTVICEDGEGPVLA